jgi:hypothetical protein
MNKTCEVLVCLGVLVSVGLLVWVLVKQHSCCSNERYDISGVNSWTEEGMYFNEHDIVENSPDLTHLGAGFYREDLHLRNPWGRKEWSGE